MTSIKEELSKKFAQAQQPIPWIVRLVENFPSLFALPGKISVKNHDILHVLLEQDLSLEGEAFVIGFCMGNEPKTRKYHLEIFQLFAQYLYPKRYQFNQHQLEIFNLGVSYGKKIKVKNINRFDLSEIDEKSYLREILCINEDELRKINEHMNSSIYVVFKKINQATKRTRINFSEILNGIGCSFTVIGGMVLAVNLKVSQYGFAFLAISSFSMLLGSIMEKNRKLTVYFFSVFICVDLLGIYRWILN